MIHIKPTIKIITLFCLKFGVIFLLLVSVFPENNYGQQYFAQCNIRKYYMGRGGWEFKDLKLFSPVKYVQYSGNTRLATYTNENMISWRHDGNFGVANDTSLTAYSVVNHNEDIALTFTFTAQINPEKYISFTVDDAKSFGQKEFLDGGYAAHLYFGLTTYDVPQFNSISMSGCDDCSSNFCVNNINENITLNLSAKSAGNVSLEVRVYNSLNATTPVKTRSIGTYASSKNVRFSDLNLQNYWGEDLYLSVRFSLGGQTVESERIYAKFFRYMPPISNPTVTRSACGNDVINVTLDPTIISQLSNYRFRLRPAGTKGGEQTSNIIPLQPGQPVGNRVPLSILSLPNFGSLIPQNGGDYTMQVFGTELAWNDDVSNISCAAKKTFNIPTKPPMLSLGSTLKTYTFTDNQNTTHTYHITSPGANDGQATLTLSGGTYSRVSRFEYSRNGSGWQTIPANQLTRLNATTYRYSSLRPGTYRVRVIDTDGCTSAIRTIGTLVEPAALLMPNSNITSKKVSCHQNNTGTGSKSDGQIVATWSGGIGPYQAVIQNSSGQSVYTQNNIGVYQFTSNANLAIGNYIIKITDSQGKYVQKTHPVTSNPEVQISTVPTPNECYGEANGSIQLTVTNKTTNNVTFTLTGESNSYTGDNSVNYTQLSAGNYTATVTNTNNCTASKPVSLIDPDEITISDKPHVVAKYGDNTGSIDFTISGGTGEFDYIFSDDNGEISTGQTAEEVNIKNLYAGYYHISVTDENDCPQTLNNIHVRQPDAPLLLNFTQQNVDCFGNLTGEVYPVASGGWGLYEYGYNGQNYGSVNTIAGLAATSAVPDTVFVVDSAGIVEKLPVIITQPNQLVSSVANVYHLKCFQDNTGAIEFSVSEGTPPYYVSENQTDWLPGYYINGLAANPAQLIYIRDENNCLVTETVEITEPDLLEIETDTIVDAFCTKSNGEIHTIIKGGTEAYAYQWRSLDLNTEVGANSNVLADVPSGRYQLVVTDDHQCEASREFPISDFDGPSVTAYEIDSVSCFNGQDGIINITEVTGGMPDYTYYIDDAETPELMAGLSAGNYHIQIVDAKGCQTNEDYAVHQPDDISIIGTITPPVCYNSFEGNIINQVSGGNGYYSYLWSTGSTLLNLENENSGAFNFAVTDWKGCSKEVDYELIPPHAPTADWPENSATLCTGNDYELDGGDFIAYNWERDGTPLSSERYFTLDEAGVYTLDITNEFGCTSTDTFTLALSDHPLDAVLLLQDSAIINELVEVIDVTWPVPDSINWFFDKQIALGDDNEWSQQFSVPEEGIVNVTLRAWYGGCFSDSTKNIVIYYSNEEVTKKSTDAMPLILGCKLWPNPNDGNFSLDVKLNEESDISVLLYSLQNHVKIFTRNYQGLKKYEIPFQFNNLIAGVYLVIVKAQSEQQSIKFIINK